jgi:hypothetical protein
VKRTPLTWYELRFPRDLSKEAVIAALSAFSGAPHRARLVLELSASHEGITHRLGVTPQHRAIVTGGLYAAIPSLRLDEVEPLDEPATRRSLWHLTSRDAVVRSDDLPAISANLLATLYPLASAERVRLRWYLGPRLRPSLEMSAESRWYGRSQALRAKLVAPGLGGHGQLLVAADSGARASQLTQQVGAALWSLSTPYGRLVPDTYPWGHLLRVFGLRGRYYSVQEIAGVIGWPIGSPNVPGLELGAARRVPPGRGLLTEGRVIGTTDFAGAARTVAISPSASTRGLYILGPTGTGKTTLIKNLVRDDLQAGRGLALVETNGDLIRETLDLIPPEREQDVVLLDANDPHYAVGFNPFAGGGDPSLIADQINELFQRLWKEYWGPRTAQLAHMGLLTLARREGSTLLDLPRLFIDPDFRASVLVDLDDPLGLEVDWRWFDALPEREQATVIAPLMNKIRAFTSRPAIRTMLGQATPAISMRSIMAEGKILLVNLPKGLIGSETATLLGCLVLTSLWQAATERAELPVAERRPFSLVVDEVQDFASAPIPWDEMFAQGRKYGLSLSVAHQNLKQIPLELREAILANARSQVLFTLSPADAKVMAQGFEPALTAADLQSLDAYSVAAAIALDDGSTARPVTLKTPRPPVPSGNAARVKQASRENYARPRADIEEALRRRVRKAPKAPVGRKPRSRT